MESPAELKKVLDWSERLSNERLVLVNMINNASIEDREDLVDRLYQFELVVAEVRFIIFPSLADHISLY